MFGILKKFIREIKEFNRYRKRNWNETTVNCGFDECRWNEMGRCDHRAIILEPVDDKYLKCLYYPSE
jgi:hypothetical protein